MEIKYGDNINVRSIIFIFFSIFFALPVFSQKENCFKELEFKEFTVDKFCSLMNDSLAVYKNKNWLKKMHTSKDLYMIVLITNTIEIYSEKIINSNCLKEEIFYNYGEWLTNILMTYDSIIGYRGLIFFKSKKKCCQKLIFIKLED